MRLIWRHTTQTRYKRPFMSLKKTEKEAMIIYKSSPIRSCNNRIFRSPQLIGRRQSLYCFPKIVFIANKGSMYSPDLSFEVQASHRSNLLMENINAKMKNNKNKMKTKREMLKYMFCWFSQTKLFCGCAKRSTFLWYSPANISTLLGATWVLKSISHC